MLELDQSYTVEQKDELGNVLLDENDKPIKERFRVQKRMEGTKAEAREMRDRLIAERDDNGRLYSEIEAGQRKLEEAKEEMTLNRMIPLWDGARRKYREEHGTARERKAFRGLHHVGNIMAVRIALATGMRRGEVFALTWEHVDLGRRTTRVCQSITYQCKVKTPKTQAGIRALAIDASTASHLDTWKNRQAEELAKIGVKQTEKTPICCSDKGDWYRIDNFDHWWWQWRKDHGFDGLKFHELRHTQATQLLANGVDVKRCRRAWAMPTRASRSAGTPTQSRSATMKPQTCSAAWSQASRETVEVTTL